MWHYFKENVREDNVVEAEIEQYRKNGIHTDVVKFMAHTPLEITVGAPKIIDQPNNLRIDLPCVVL